jgi:hypothetical protein
MNAHSDSIRLDSSTVAVVERQMQRWLLQQENHERPNCPAGTAHSDRRYRPYITISREAGADGASVARLVGVELGWQVFDKELLDLVAQRCHSSRAAIEQVDEAQTNWMAEAFNTWIDHSQVPHFKYLHNLGAVVRLAALRANSVFVGRGSQFFLPRAEGLSVRIIASAKYRVAQIMALHSVTRDRAKAFVEETDRNRREFVRQHFHHDVGDPELYDLVINVEQLRPTGAARQIVDAAKGMFAMESRCANSANTRFP